MDIPRANAQTITPVATAVSDHNKLGLIAVLAEEELLDDIQLRTHIFRYAENAQERIAHSQAIVFGVNKDESTFKIASVLEKLYFEGMDSDTLDTNILNNDDKREDDNKLIGIVIVGDVPIPVVHEDNSTAQPSLYPYTDFYRKKYIYNYETDKFETNGDVTDPTPEIWHGVIVPPDKNKTTARDQLIEFFEKNEAYSDNDPEYADFEKRMLYANYPALEKQMNFMDYRNYERYNKYVEEMEFNRYNRHLLRELIGEVSADMESEELIVPQEAIDAMMDINTETFFKTYTSTLAKASKIYLGKLNDVMKTSGRWGKSEIDTPVSLITIRDGYAQKTLHRKQLELEKQIDTFILNTVPASEREFELITDAKLKVKTDIVDIGGGTKNFTFYSYIDGKLVSETQSIEDCGMYTGQKRQSGEAVLENNSVYVEANRLYDPESAIESDDLEDEDEYKDHAGCVYNNSIEITIDDLELGPHKCTEEESIMPLFSVRGARETNKNFSAGDECSVKNMSFHPGNDGVFNQNAKSGGFTTVKLSSVINKAYSELVDDGYITNPATGIRQKSTEVIKALLKTGTKVKYSPSFGVDLEISASENGATAIDYFETHVEPTNETLQIIKQTQPCDPHSTELSFPEIVTPSTPADGIRYVEFAKNDQKKNYQYLNLYRVDGENPTEIIDNLTSTINSKDTELGQKTGAPTVLTSQFFLNNLNLSEPIIWNSLGADQKLVNIIPKYLDKNSSLPAPTGSTNPPVVKPDGYEVLHIVADGDVWGYQFGLNKAMKPAPEIEEGEDEEEGEEGEGEGEEIEGEAGGEQQYICGDPSGVEIWEWFGALQCWIEEEILVLDELIKLDDSCGAEAPAPIEDIEEFEIDPLNDILTIPAKLEVTMGRKSLVNGEMETIGLYPLNEDDESVYGYIEDPVHLELADQTLGEFDKNDFHIFSGEDSVNFTAKKTGTTTLTITMGDDLPSTSFSIHVYDSIKIKFEDTLGTIDGSTVFGIEVSLLDPGNNPITDVNTDIVLAPMKPADGKFEKNGRVQLENGQGQAIFHHTPGPPVIYLISKDPYYTSEPYPIEPPPAQPVALTIKPPRYIPVGGTVNIPVSAVDIYGNAASNFNKTISVSLHEDTEDYANILTPTLTLSGGEGTIRVKAGKLSGEIQLIAKHEDLRKGMINISILARMESKDWAVTYPQNLFASFVGFPAGNFLEEDYFGGTHLFNGKTEAVFSFMTGPTSPPVLSIAPNYKITPAVNYQTIHAEFPDNKILLQVFDQNTLQTVLSKEIQLNFKEVRLWEDEGSPEENVMYLDLISDSYQAEQSGQDLTLSDFFGNKILDLKTNKIYLPDPSYQLIYNREPEFDLIELILTNGFEEIARVMLSFKPTTLNPNDFDEINDLYIVQKTYGGKSTKDPNGLVLYDPRTEVIRENIGEYYGLEGDNKYLKLFAGGAPVGEAVKFNLPSNGVLLGDPTIQLKTKTSGGLNYDASVGRKIFQDPEGSNIVSINELNFNNDPYKDVALVMQDGRIRLIEGGSTEPMFRDKGDIAFLADGAVAIERFDFAEDGYEDLLIATDEGRLAILHNDKEVIDRTDQKIKVGKKLYALTKGDMDADGFEDLVTLDSRGDIRIFYNDNGKFAENGKLIGNYGFSLKLEQNLHKDLDVRYPGLVTPSTGIGDIDISDLPMPDLPTPVVTPSSSTMDALENFGSGGSSAPSESESDDLWEAAQQLAEAAREDPTAAAGSGPPLLPWPEENNTETKADDELETYFAPAEDISFLTIAKNVHNKERPNAKNIDLEENLVYTIQITSNINKNNVVLADTVPDALTPLLDTAQCEGNGCDNFEAEQIGIRLFLAGLDLKANQPVTITYEVLVKHTPQAGFFIKKLTGHSVPNDQYLDIMVSPPYNNTTDFIQHYTTAPRTYDVRSTSEDVKPQTPSAAIIGDAWGDLNDMLAGLKDIDPTDENLKLEDIQLPEGMAGALCEEMGGNQCLESADNPESCTSDFLDDLAQGINDFACMGGGCFPIPWNFTFLVPPQMPLPIFAFPAGPGPYPIPGTMAMPGAAAVPGTYQSMIRFYMGLSLTGGMGIAMCWGPYMGSSTPPPPSMPIPYPPPVGNCMVTALPRDKLPWHAACDALQDAMNWVMEGINSGINKINSAVADVNNDDSLPVGFEQGGGSEEGAGGLEISLAVNLGESMKFEPPVKSFSNIHIPTFDSLMGKISDWVDRQTMEITNKLLRFPTFYLYLPDIKSLFTLDTDRMVKQFNIWIENVSKSPKVTKDALGNIWKSPPETTGSVEINSSDDLFRFIRLGLKKGETSKVLKYMGAVEAQARIFNLNLLDGLYDTVNALPLVNLTERPIEFKIPWLSSAEIQAFIMELERWVLHYQRELARVIDIWEKYSCQDQPEGENASEKAENAIDCGLRQIADAFIVDFDATIESVQENIEVLQMWLAFPRQFVKFKQQLIGYIQGVACYLNTYAQMMGGWYAKLQEQIISWAELILTIMEIIKNWKKLFDVFLDFDTSCSICTNERYANFGWWMLLGLIIPDIPIISFPRLPDIVLDMSDMDIAINIELPTIHLSPEPLPLPPLPYLRLPDIPSINLFLQLPKIPVLPRPPEFPDLPELPPIPVVDLPGLPAPPKLPDIGVAFEIIIEILEKILKIWCLLKKAFAPIPESMLNDQITLITNRPAYLIPLDILKLQLPNIALFDLGFNELRIETVLYLGVRIMTPYQALQDASDAFNKGKGDWPGTENLSKVLDEAYAIYIEAAEEKAQEKLDEIGAYMEEAVSGWEEDINEDLDLEDVWEGADDYFRQKEQEWQDSVDEFGEEYLNWTYQDYVNAINHANDVIQNGSGWWPGFASIRDDIDTFFDEYSDYIYMLNYFIPFATHLEQLSNLTYEDDLIDYIKDVIATNLDAGITGGMGPVVMDDLFEYLEACFKDKDECKNEDEYFSYNNQSDQLNNLLAELKHAIEQINNSELVDYKKVKEDLNVPDLKNPASTASIDKIQWMRKELLAYSDKLEEETEQMKNVKDLYALAEVPPLRAFPYELASEEYEPIIDTEEMRIFTSAVIPKEPVEEMVELKEKTERKVKASPEESSESNNTCSGVCLPDPITSQPTPFVPSLEYPVTSETLFMDSEHVIYNDGTGLYLKRDLTISESVTNMAVDVPDRIFRIDDLAEDLWYSSEPLEAINMLKTTLTENGSSNFAWQKGTNPNIYGYGIELERSILGFNADKQKNNLPDVKFVLLPADEDGETPEATVDNRYVIPYGTLVTSMTDEEMAQKHFGIKSDNIITGAKTITFSTINNATISVDDNTAFFFDKYTGPDYSIDMENGFYHIKMTWFDKFGRVATYNHNELLSPQIYAGAPPPIDIAFDKTYYVPIYKEKMLQASKIFVDMGNSYEYYWFDKNDNLLTPGASDTYLFPPQYEPKEKVIKLIATQNIEDENFERYEKIFKVIVYVPPVELNGEKLSEGTVEGNLALIPEAPDDDLGDIPFSLFRKRWNTWKNLGLLMDKKDEKTNPPLSDHQSRKYEYQDGYYSFGEDGDYIITGLDTSDPSPIIVKDANGDLIASIIPGTGRIELASDDYKLQALPSATDLPTRIAIIEIETELIVANVYYVSDSNTDVIIRAEPLTMTNILDIGVTAGDANPNDDIIAKNIPGYGPSYPGGIAIYNQTPPQKNVTLVDTDGSIRMMQAGYKLRLKNEGAENEPYIFQIITEDEKSIFDIYIHADFENLEIKQDLVMDDAGIQIGLKEQVERLFGPIIPQLGSQEQSDGSTPEGQANGAAATGLQQDNPFPDLDSTHPFFSEILELYKLRIISGYGDGTFRPSEKISRAEFIKIALGVTNCYDCTTPTDPQREKYTPVIPFPDVRLPAWYYFCIWIAKDLQMITGYGDGFFRPARNISRAEAAAVLLRQSQIEIVETPDNAFADVPDYAWYKDYVYTAVDIGLIKETGGFVFPDEEITRGEFAFMGMGVVNMYDCHEVDEDEDGMPDWWEMENNLDPLFAGDATSDNDGDGLTALEEYRLGTADIEVPPEEICPCIDNPNQNDTDGDGIIDACDEDLDNDTIPNIICLFDDSGLVDPEKLQASEDNCVFVENTDQVDSDMDNIGDLCEALDLCPPVPEDMDGVDDEDGCPEVDDIFPDDPPGVYVTPGPTCSFLDYLSDLVEGDIIMTAITDIMTHDIIFEASNEETYNP